MKLTERAFKLLIALAVIVFIGLVFKDVLMSLLALAFFTAIAIDFFFIKYKLKAFQAEVEPRDAMIRLIAGESRIVQLCVKTSANIQMDELNNWLKLSSKPSTEGLQVDLRVEPKLSGEYSLNSLKASIFSPLRLFKGYVEMPFDLRVKAYPRTLPLIVEILKLISLGLHGFGSGVAGKRKGLGLEYFETREYMPGDQIRFMDWKATARLCKLMVKEFLEEAYGSSCIIYDVRAPGPITSDESSSLFLSAVLGAASAGLPIDLTIKSSLEILSAEALSPIDALKIALAYVLKRQEISEWDIYELVEPKPSRRLLRILREIKAEGSKKLLSLRLKEDVGPTLKLIRRKGAKLDIAYVGLILYSSRLLIELADEAKVKGHRLRVFTPAKPWVDAKDLEEAYVMYSSQHKVLSALKSYAVDIINYSLKP